MASLRNLAIGALRLAGHPNLAAALRHTGRDPCPAAHDPRPGIPMKPDLTPLWRSPASSAPTVGNQMTVPEVGVPGLIPLAWTHLALS